MQCRCFHVSSAPCPSMPQGGRAGCSIVIFLFVRGSVSRSSIAAAVMSSSPRRGGARTTGAATGDGISLRPWPAIPTLKVTRRGVCISSPLFPDPTQPKEISLLPKPSLPLRPMYRAPRENDFPDLPLYSSVSGPNCAAFRQPIHMDDYYRPPLGSLRQRLDQERQALVTRMKEFDPAGHVLLTPRSVLPVPGRGSQTPRTERPSTGSDINSTQTARIAAGIEIPRPPPVIARGGAGQRGARPPMHSRQLAVFVRTASATSASSPSAPSLDMPLTLSAASPSSGTHLVPWSQAVHGGHASPRAAGTGGDELVASFNVSHRSVSRDTVRANTAAAVAGHSHSHHGADHPIISRRSSQLMAKFATAAHEFDVVDVDDKAPNTL